jgi:hypothetical protein
MIKKIRILNVSFDHEIKGFELPAFRGAIIEKVGKDNLLFHNHFDDTRFRYSYPLIQYKQINHKPAIFCVDFGVDEIHKFFEQRDWSLKISDRVLDMRIDSLQMNQFTMQVWDKKWKYSITNWLALNQENYKKYNELDSLTEKIQMLENTMKGNILSLAKGIDWTVDKQIELNIVDIKNTHAVTKKKKMALAFDLDFTTNVFLPNYIGLGKSVSLGFGMVKKIRE